MVRPLLRRPFLVLALLVAVQALPGLWSRDFAAGDEVRHADALRNLQEDGHAVVLRMNGRAYPDKPPVYFWLVDGLSRVLGSREAPVWFLAAALSGLALLGATSTLARTAGARREDALLAGLLLLATPLFLLLTRTTRSDALFSALIVLSEACLFRGLSEARPSRWVPVGLFVAAAATLVKGPLGVAFPLVGATVWLAWDRRLSRLLRPDVALGLLVALATIGAWVLAAWRVQGGEFLRALWEDQLRGRAFGSSAPHAKPPWFYAFVLPLVCLPWTPLLIARPWRPAETTADPALPKSVRTFLWSHLVSGVVLLSLFRSKFENYLLPLLPHLAILTSVGVARADPRRLRPAWFAIGGAGIALAIALPFADSLLSSALDHPVRISGLLPTALVLGATGVAVLLATRGPAVRPAWVVATGVSLAVAVGSALAGPSIDALTSPREQARELARRMDAGAAALGYRVYPGTYSWHAGRTIPETDDLQEVVRFLARPGPVVVATPRKYRDRHPEVFAGMQVAHEQWIEGQPHLLLVRDGAPR